MHEAVMTAILDVENKADELHRYMKFLSTPLIKADMDRVSEIIKEINESFALMVIIGNQNPSPQDKGE